METKWWRERDELEKAEMRAVQETTFGLGMWRWKRRRASERRFDLA